MPELHDERIRRTSKEMLNKVFSDEDIAQLQKMIPKSINGFDIRFEINLEPPIIPEEFDGAVRTADILFELQVVRWHEFRSPFVDDRIRKYEILHKLTMRECMGYYIMKEYGFIGMRDKYESLIRDMVSTIIRWCNENYIEERRY